VIIKHVIGSAVVYSQYSHMESIPTNLTTACGAIDANRRHRRTCGTPVQIDAGNSVGTVGCTRFGLSTCDSSFGSHLHFEIKDFGTLGSTGDDSGEFGYSTIHPELNGYIDPILNLHQLTSISDTQVRVTSFGQGINIRVGPGDYRTYQRTVAAGEEFVAIATAPATTTPACSDGWYLILATSLTQETRVVNGDLYFNDLSRTPSAIPDAWICKGNAGQVWVQSVAAPATLTSPTPGSKLAGTSVTFAWNAGSGVSQYWFYVGTSAGGNDLYGQSQGTNRSVTVSGLPTDGRNLYVRLWSQISGSWQFNDYTYTAAGTAVTNTKASITSPTPGSKLAGASVTFAWNAGSGVSQYWLYVGTSAGGNDLYGQSQGTNRSATVSGLPTDGRNLYVRLWSQISGSWQFNDYTYTAAGTAVTNTKASITSPTPGSKLAGASVTFAWNAGSGVSQYWFYVGTSAGGNDLYGQSQGTNRSVTVSGLPTDGRNLYVRLWSLISGTWQFNDYTYTAAGIKLIVFPIPNRTYSTVSINSVFDHSMNTPYCSDNLVIAYTGEEGRSIYGSTLVGNIAGCGNLYGFKNANATVFSVGGQYTGAGTPQYLSYDGHPGYDYRTTDQCPGGKTTADCPTGILGQIRIRAAADGRVSNIFPSYGRVQIDHGDGYETWYMHLSKIDVAVGQSVMAGDYIGISGDTGSTGSPHLHFEVRLNGIPVDPYGWQGSGVDPYTLDENVWLW